MKVYLVGKILENLDADSNIEITAEWQNKVKKRCAEIDSGNVILKEADEVFKDAFYQL